jgi:hypothetical protein
VTKKKTKPTPLPQKKTNRKPAPEKHQASVEDVDDADNDLEASDSDDEIKEQPAESAEAELSW